MGIADELGFDPRNLDGQPGSRGYQIRMASLKRDEARRAEVTGESVDAPPIVMNQAAGPAAALAAMIPGGFIPPSTGAPQGLDVPFNPAEYASHTSVGPTQQRVAIYVARGDKLSVAVESAPEWDTQKQWKLDEATVVALLPILRCLGVKIKDTTGELDELELSYAVGSDNQGTNSWSESARRLAPDAPQDQQAGSRAAPKARRRAAG